jgi:exonuclease III
VLNTESECDCDCTAVISADVSRGIIFNNQTEYIRNMQYNVNTLKVLSWNIQGIGRKLELKEINELVSSYDIVFLYETMKLDSYHPDIDGYKYVHYQRSFQHPKSKRPSGGIAVLIKDQLYKSKLVTIVKSMEYVIWLKISQRNNPELYLGGLYIPPQGSTINVNSSYSQDIFNEIRADISSFLNKTSYVSICGDLNSRTGELNDVEAAIPGTNSNLIDELHDVVSSITGTSSDWPFHHRQSKDKVVNKYGKELLDLCKSSNLRIMNGYYNADETDVFTCYTPLGQSVVDYLLCTPGVYSVLQKFEIGSKVVESDHTPLSFWFQIPINNMSKDTRHVVAYEPKLKLYKYIFDKNKLHEYLANFDRDDIQNILFTLSCSMEKNADTDVIIDETYQYLTDCIEPTFTKKKYKSNKCTFPTNMWFDDECKKLRKLVNSFAKNYDLSIELRKNEYNDLCKSYKQTIQRKKRQFQQINRDNLDKLFCGNQSECWKYWNKLKRSRTNKSGAPNLNQFHEYFLKQSQPPSRDYFDVEHMEYITHALQMSTYACSDPLSCEICDSIITETEVSLHLKKLKCNKAAGLDGIPAEFYKYASERLIAPFCSIFNYIFDKGEYPTLWSEGLINALHKKGDKSDPDNYRKITINVVMGKIFDSILNSRLYFKNEVLDLDDSCQFGFTPVTDCVFILDTIIRYQKLKHKPLYLCFIDFTKAFDYINRNALYHKLICQKIGHKMLNIIMSMFDKAKARVNHSGNVGNTIDSKCGVLQGGVLSPKLFNEFLSDLPDNLNKTDGIILGNMTVTHISYADDIVLLAHSEQSLQNSINSLHNFCKKWHLIVNVGKTKTMKFDVKSQTQLIYNNQLIENVDTFKYLGHVLSSKRNTHKQMTDYLVTQSQKALFALQCDTKQTLGYINPQLSFKMFDTYILPILEYNAEIWYNNKSVIEIERIQLGYLKNVLGVRKQTPTLTVYGETGRFPLEVRQKIKLFNFWIKLEKLSKKSILKRCLLIQKEMHSLGHDSWFCKVNYLLGEHLPQVDQSKLEHIDFDIIMKDFKNIIYQKTQQIILSEINDSKKQPKLRTYKLFKLDYRLEPYLSLNLSRKNCSKISRFRMSSHKLRIETGRHENPKIPDEERFCLKCNTNEIEDEIHCLLLCPQHALYRDNLIHVARVHINNFDSLNNVNKFINIMTSKEPDLLKALGTFLIKVDI